MRRCVIFNIDIAVPGDSRVASKENEKVQKYQDLTRELRKLWQVKVKVVVGALGTIPKALEKHLKEIGTSTSIRVELLRRHSLRQKGFCERHSRSKATGRSLT